MDLKQTALMKKLKQLPEKLKKRPIVPLLLGLGIVLLLLAPGAETEKEQVLSETPEVPQFSLEEAEEELEAALEKIDGAGKVDVVLTLVGGYRAELAMDADANSMETVIVSGGSGKQQPVIRRYLLPEYQGALIIAQGGGAATTRLRLTEAVAALTGLSKDRISVLKMQEGRT